MSDPELPDFQTILELYKSRAAEGRSEFDASLRRWVEKGCKGNGPQVDFNYVSFHYLNSDYPLLLEELRLHEIWYQVIQVFKHTDECHEAQQRLVLSLVALRETGYLPLPPLGDGSPRSDSFSDGRRLWPEFPLFSPALIEEYTTRYWDKSHYDDVQRENMAAAIGRLLSIGIYDGPALVALSLFREVLETDRPLLPASADTDGQQEVPISVEQGIKFASNVSGYAENGLILLASNRCGAATSVPHLNYADFPDLSAPGELAIKSGLVSSDLRGYSPGRWAFWKKRVEELSAFEGSTLAESDKAENGGSWATLSGHADFIISALGEAERSTQFLEHM
ncbi:unnamed protein product [Clonostachys solani]|uniref:Uncharacterized protein n=1 Tax=Clonostachys solani TaxID=160281 RepID=A0A9N9Z4F8_9HYPO|nr:unnamed protein product [Clonostachys solani]